jgi:hypothetical protein
MQARELNNLMLEMTSDWEAWQNSRWVQGDIYTSKSAKTPAQAQSGTHTKDS